MKTYKYIGRMNREVIFEPKKGEPFYVCLKALRSTNFIPAKNDNECIFLVKFILVLLLYFSLFFQGLIHLVMTIRNETGVNISEDVAVIVNFGGLITSCILFTVHYKKWLSTCSIIVDFTEFGKPANFEKAQRQGEVHTIAMYVYALVGTIGYLITALFEAPGCEQSNEKLDLHEVCGTLGPLWLPTGTPSVPVVIVINVIQLSAALGTFYSSISVAFMIYYSTLLVLTHIDHFEVLFHSIFEETDVTKRSNKLRQCINYHKNILRMGTQLSSVSKLNQGHAFISSAVCIGCIGNQILMEKSIRSFMLLMGYTTGLFVLCHSGQIMTDKTGAMQEIVYFSKWYTCEPKMMKDVKFVLARCKNPIYLSVLPFGYINYPLFLMIVKTSYSYLTLLNQTT